MKLETLERDTLHERRFTVFSLADFFSILLEGKGQLKRPQEAFRGRHRRVGRTFGVSWNPADRSQFL